MTKKKNPQVSVIMSVYNGAGYLAESIESILNQTFTDFEFIIINDASTDETANILEHYADVDQRIRVLSNNTNFGLAKSLNIGIEAAQGQYIARQDADDISLPERFKEQVAFLDANPAVGVVGTFMQRIDETGSPLDIYDVPTNHNVILWKTLFRMIVGEAVIAHPTTMLRRSVINQVNGYNPAFRVAQDYGLWLTLAKHTKFANLPQILFLYRMTGSSICHTQWPEQKRVIHQAQSDFIMELLDGQVKKQDIEQFQIEGNLTEEQAIANITLIIKCYSALVEQGILISDDTDKVLPEVAKAIAVVQQRIPVQSPNPIPINLARAYWKSVLPKPLLDIVRRVVKN